MSRFKKEWKIFRQDIKNQAEESLLFWINWYILKPTALILCIIVIIII